MFIKFEDQKQLNNLLIFMQRVRLEGSEVPEYNKLMAVLTTPVDVIEKNVEE